MFKDTEQMALVHNGADTLFRYNSNIGVRLWETGWRGLPGLGHLLHGIDSLGVFLFDFPDLEKRS